MSSKKFVYLFIAAIVCGFMVGDTAYGQGIGALTTQGTVTNPDGTPAAGLTIRGDVDGATLSIEVTATSAADGSYKLVLISFGNEITAGDVVTLTVSDSAQNIVGTASYIVTAADLPAPSIVDIDIALPAPKEIKVEADPLELPADGTSTSTITVTVRDGGEGVTGDTVSVSTDNGTVDATATEVGNGVYTATYTAPPTLPFIPVAQINVSSANTDQSTSTAILLIPVPTMVTVDVSPTVFSADTPSDGEVTVTVTQVGPVTDETVTLALSPAVGSVSAVTNNGDGTYSATYTSGSDAGNVTLTATATNADVSETANIVINAGPPAAIAVSAAHTTITSLDSTTITAMVTDSNGNGVGGLTLTASTTSGGTVGEFTATTFGTYVATYTAPMVEMGGEGPETVTVATDGISGDVTLNLTSEPPIEVNILTVEGVVYKEDGGVPADGATITVTIGSHQPQTRTTDSDGSYEVTLVEPLGVVATNRDYVTLAVTDANIVTTTVNGVAISGDSFRLSYDLLETVKAGMSVMADVTTDIVIPPRSVNVLEVMGTVYKEDGTTSAGGGLDVVVTRGSMTQTVQTDAEGSYSATFVDLLNSVATSIDNSLSVAVSDSTGERGRNGDPLSNMELGLTGDASVSRDVTTNIGLTSNVLAVLGTVYLKNGDTEHVPARSHLREGDLTVAVTNTTRNLSQSITVDDAGEYGVTFFDALGAVSETGDVLTVNVTNDAGANVGSATHTLTIADLQTARVDIDILSEQPAEVRVFAIEGNVVNTDGSPAGAGLEVSIRLDMHGTVVDVKTTTDATGEYTYNFVNLSMPVAATGDILMIDVLREADQFRGHTVIELRSYQLVYLNQPLRVDAIMLVPPRLELGGLSINPHYTGIQDPIIQQFLNMDLAALAASVGSDIGGPEGDLLASIPPSELLLISPILAAIGAYQLELPAGFDPDDENIAMESFGNAITTRPTAWAALSAEARHTGRWVNGDQLNLYISGAPTIESVTFMLNGTPMSATSVPDGGSFMYSFQLEEEMVALFSGAMPTFGAVQLMIDGHQPIDMARSSMGVWSADVALSPGANVSYYYMVELAKPYVDPIGGIAIRKFPFIDPRNRQLNTSGLSQAIEGLLQSELVTLDPGIRSVFSVPGVDYQQSLWVGTVPLAADGAYQLDVNVSYRGGYQESIAGKMFYVDQTPPTTDVALNLGAPGHNAGLYMREDGTYVATGPMPGEASLTVSLAGATSNEPDGAYYLYQLAKLDGAGYPGAWNPVIAADLLPLDLETLITRPGSVLPLTGGGPVDMLIRNSAGGGILGTYGLRAVGIDSLLNMDSGRGPGVVVDIVKPDPDIAEISYVSADFDGNGAIEGLEMQSAAGDIAVFSDSLVTLTVDIVERTPHPLASIALEFQIPGSGWQPIGMYGADQLAATMAGDQMMVTLPVPDFPSMPDRGGHIMVRTVTTNALNVVHEQVVSAMYLRRTAPEVSAIHTYVTDRHPDSGAAQGLITVSAFTQAMTGPPTVAVQLEIRRSADANWRPLGIVQIANSKVTSHVQLAIIEDLINSIVAGAPSAPISPLYREWPLTIDSASANAMLEDTITADDVLASDDDNPYVLRAVAVDTAAARYESADGVTDSFSLDNYSPTAITQVANEDEMVVLEGDRYHVSGLIAEGVPDPMLTLTARTGAHPNAFLGGLKLAVGDDFGEPVEIDETAFSPSGNHNYTGVFNLGSIPNGLYTFRAVAHTADGATEERIVAMEIIVEVGNFTPPDNFADPTVDILSVTNTRGDAHNPSEIDAQYTTGFPAVGEEVCVTLTVPNVSASDVDVLIGDDLMSAAMMGALTVMDPDANNNISVCLDTSGLGEDMYSLVGTVTKPNGSVQFGLPSIRVDRTAPVIKIVSPLEGHQVGSLPTVQVTYSDDTGFDPEKTNPRAVTVTFTRLGSHKTVTTNPEMIRSISAAGEVLTQSGSIVYTHDDPLAGSAYRVDVTVTDALGNTATAEPVEFTSEGVAASVSIITPAAGQVVDPDQPFIISAAFTGSGEITVEQFLINGGTNTPQSVKDNLLTHTIQPPFGVLFKRGSGNRITIKIVDEEGNTAEATSNFAVAKDVTPPVVATYSPLGIIRTDRPIAAATVTDESGINTRSLTIIIAGVPGNQGTGRRSSKTSTTVTFTPSISVTPGPYTARVTVEDVHGNRTEAEWQFTVELDVTPPSITTSSPHGVIRSDKPIISVSASDDMSGVDTIDISVKGERWPVVGVTTVRSDKTSATFTPTSALASGTYTVNVRLADMSGNKASGQWQFTIELDTIPPSIILTRPVQEHTENRRPTISASYTDNMSGIEVGSIKFSLDGAEIKPNSRSRTQVMFTPTRDLNFGQHTVNLQVSDKAGNTTDEEWVFYVERMGIADARNYPNPFDHETTIAFRVSRQAKITIRVYDFTGRLVAVPLSNSVREAGLVEVDWHGETSAGDHLARGVYFCHILMESELEPQSAILKMAIVAD